MTPAIASEALEPAANLLIDHLPAPQRRRLLALCRLRELGLDQVLSAPGVAGAALLFPLSGLVSVALARTGIGATQLLMIGSEGLIGATGGLGSGREALCATVTARGVALGLDRRRWGEAMAATPRLGPLLHRYQCLQLRQLARSAVCLGFHEGQQRLARWLLEAAERSGESLLTVTHERLGRLLGLRRSGVTVFAGQLQARGLIDYHRGRICVLDPAGLESVACACYREDRSSRERAFPSAGARS